MHPTAAHSISFAAGRPDACGLVCLTYPPREHARARVSDVEDALEPVDEARGADAAQGVTDEGGERAVVGGAVGGRVLSTLVRERPYSEAKESLGRHTMRGTVAARTLRERRR